MKNLVLIFVAFALLFSSCIKEDENSCPTPAVDAYVYLNGLVTFQIEGSGQSDYYEIEYGSTGFSRDNGTRIIVTSEPKVTLTNGIYDVYIRSNCGGDEWSNWSEVKSFLVDNGQNPSNCGQPINLSYYYDELNWYPGMYNNYFQIEYGPTGFTLGSGTTATTNDDYYDQPSNLTIGNVYDFFVRGNCGSNDWSGWAGPFSFVAE